jgi:hypothetical protein
MSGEKFFVSSLFGHVFISLSRRSAMKVFHYGLTLSLIAALMNPLPATADDEGRKTKVFDVCVNSDPATGSVRLHDSGDGILFTAGDGFVAVGIIVPGGTIPTDGVLSCSSLASQRIGTFFAQGRIVVGLPDAAPDDLAYVDWQFRIDGRGAIDTTGPVKIVPVLGTYPQTITGATGEFASVKGQATTTALDVSGFQFRLTVSSKKEKED